MRYTRQGKIQFTTKDPICAVQLLSLTKFMDIDVFTDIIWENISARFLVADISTTTPLEKLAKEIQDENDCLVEELRRFVKLNSSKVISPVLITILGEARRIFQQKNAKYAESVKTLPAVSNIEESINAKFENLLKAVNDRFEQQMQLFADMLQKSMNCILQNFFKIIEQSVDPSSSPARKKTFLSKLNQISNTFTPWDAGGSSEVEQMPLS
ncbi:hypothetical protein AVEN_217194-1 [Araneus ventricosus]|uniref:Uncharacterized protein n=1 Tax=Araneus ventricosus TaxID=182803 RepID=A0A4Y2J1A3_ARAVE|nr:hypothetical protein AVEN_217194-1 [Araneus ventricosus]